MKIVYALESTGLYGGTKVILRQAEALTHRGHEVMVVSPEPFPTWFETKASQLPIFQKICSKTAAACPAEGSLICKCSKQFGSSLASGFMKKYFIRWNRKIQA